MGTVTSITRRADSIHIRSDYRRQKQKKSRPGRPEPIASAPCSWLGIIKNGVQNTSVFERFIPFENQLCNPVTGFDAVRGVGQIHEDNTHDACVIWINDAGEDIDAVVQRQSGSWCDARVSSFGTRDADARRKTSTFTRLECICIDGGQIKPCGKIAFARWNFGRWMSENYRHFFFVSMAEMATE